jgi:ribosomal protein L11 methyltransferase
MKWVELTVHTSLLAEDAVANILIEEGSGGVVFSEQPNRLRPTRAAQAYFPFDDDLEPRLLRVKTRIHDLRGFGLDPSPARLILRQVEDRDWAEAWKKFFKPIVIGDIVVKPSWETFERTSPGQIILELDPGMAFGTGTHATTQLCLELLQKYVRPGDKVLDIGTGSGILSIAAAMLGASRVVGLDVDQLAVSVARENIRRNGVADRVSIYRGDSLGSLRFRPNVVVANILANTVIAFAPAVAEMLAEGGVYITSGIVNERKAEVAGSLTGAGLNVVETLSQGEWAAVVGVKGEQEF